ncbi:MAG: hypothetical protein PHF51_00680 [Candidatus ainarchaeum sp.]|nr:hypothetical protein [Candidatus ainarchaeum sp.]
MATETRLLALLLVVALSAPVLYAETLEDFVTPYLYPGENFSSDAGATQISAGGSQFVLVKVKGVESFFLSRSESGGETRYAFVNDSSRINSAIREYYASANYHNATELDHLIGHISAFNASRYPAEFECKTSIGLDRPGATCGVTRCESCMNVPFCADKMAYFGSDFAASIHQFEVDTGAEQQGLKNAVAAATAMKGGAVDAAVYSSYLTGNLTAAQAGAQAVQTNHLFGCFEITGSQLAPAGLEWCAYRSSARMNSQWCRDVPANFSQLTEAMTDSNAISGRIVSNASALSRAQALYNSMNARFNFVRMSEENESFRALYSQVEGRASNASRAASIILARVSDDELSADLAALSELLLRVSQYGIDRNFSAANASAVQLFVLSEKVDAETRNLTADFGAFMGLNNDTALALFRARLYLDPQDRSLIARLNAYSEEKEEIDRVVGSGLPMSRDAVAQFSNDLRFIGQEADDVASEKLGQRTLQAGTWVAGAARRVSIFAIDLVAGALSLSGDARETYARTLPTVAIIASGAFAYFACLAVFALLKARGVIRLNRLSVVLWAIIFAFLFVLMGVAVATANSVVQQEMTRSTFDLFSSRLAAANSTAVIVASDGAPAGALPLMSSCANAVSASLSASGKTVRVYALAGGACTEPSGAAAGDACTRDVAGAPALVLGYANQTTSSFSVYYSTRGFVSGPASFHSDCLVARALAGS